MIPRPARRPHSSYTFPSAVCKDLRAAADKWLARDYDDIGRSSNVEVCDEFQQFVAEHIDWNPSQ